MSAVSKAVFLSYASQDAEAARRIADALRAAGVEVWFDQNELTGGDAWDAKIRGQIKACALFVPVISANTNARREGYFRREWKLAVDRTHDMDEALPFLLPVVIDGTSDAGAFVPEKFREVQWTRLPGGETPAAFCARVGKLLEGEVACAGSYVGAPLDGARGRGGTTTLQNRPRRWLWPGVLGVAAIVALAIWQPWKAVPSSDLAAPRSARPTGEKTAALHSPARQLAERANAMSLKNYNSTVDDFAAAEGLLKEALALDQNDAEIWAISSLFNTSIRTRGFDATPARREVARSQAERALKLNPTSVEGLFALARWQRDHEPDPAVAEKTFQAVLARAPDHEQALGSLATHYDRLDRFEEAIAMFERAARNPRAMPLARYGQYLAYFNRWHFAEAERCLRESVAAQPSANSVTGLAMVLLTARGDATAAVRALADMPVAHRSEHRAVWMSANAHLAARDPEGALTALRRLSADYIQDNWFAGPTAYWVGRAHAQAGRAEAARIAFESGLAVMDAKLKATPGDFALHVARGELLAWVGRTEEALREARTATELAGGRELRLWFVSPVRIYAALGRADEALPLLEKFCARGSSRVGWPLTPALLKIDPLWDKLRGDARFQALVAEATSVEP